jgi:hypothetical protein
LYSWYDYASIGEENSKGSDDSYNRSIERSEDEEIEDFSRENNVPEDLRDLLQFYNELDDDEDDFEVDRRFEDIENVNEVYT